MYFGDFDLAALLPFIAVGFAAQLVDSAFGMISNTRLVGAVLTLTSVYGVWSAWG